MVISGTNGSCSVGDIGKNSIKNKDDVYANPDLTARESQCTSLSSVGKLKKFMSPLVFLGTLECVDGMCMLPTKLDELNLRVISIGWAELKSNICGLLYLKRCFDNAISMGKDLPMIDIDSLLRRVLNDSEITADPTKKGMFTIEESTQILHMSDYIGDIFFSLSFNKNVDVLNKSHSNFIENLIKDHEHTDSNVMHNINHMSIARHLKDIVNYPFSSYANNSGVDRGALKNIIYGRIEDGMLRHSDYCPTISKYMPSDASAIASESIVIARMPESNIDTTSCTELTAVVLALTIVGILLFTFYATSRSIRRRNYAFGPKNSASVSRNNVDYCSLNGKHYLHLSEFLVENV